MSIALKLAKRYYAPMRLIKDVRSIQQELAGMARDFAPVKDESVETFIRVTRTAWQNGEVRPVHHR